MAEALVRPTKSATLRLAPVTDAAVAETIKSVKRDYENKVGVKASTAGGGSGQVFISTAHRQLAAAGYVGWRKTAGIEAGGEVTWDLKPKPRT